MTIIGVTGPYASGKSTLAGVLEQRGWKHVEVDVLGHQALVSRQEDIIRTFGEEISRSHGEGGELEIDRKALGRIVFADQSKLALLESIVHPEMVSQCREIIHTYREESGEPGILLNAALLYRMKLHWMCDFVLWITAPRLTRMFRARQRDGLSWNEIKKRMAAQSDINPKLVTGSVDMYKVDTRSKAAAIQRIDEILQVRVWSKTEPT